MNKDNTTRFSNRVEDYVKYRPNYPKAIVDFLQKNYQLTTGKVLADIGSGTGISSSLFLEAGHTVIAVEPNREMRNKSVELLGRFESFKAVEGTAEKTTLAASSVDAVIVGQAFHWFDAAKAKAEFKRILKAGGLVVLIWNERKTGTAYEIDYDALIVRHAIDYVQVDHRNINREQIAAFFAPQSVELAIFSNKQLFDFDGLKGRLLSSSYMPAINAAGYEAMMLELKILFDKHEQDGLITIGYATKVYVGIL